MYIFYKNYCVVSIILQKLNKQWIFAVAVNELDSIILLLSVSVICFS